MAIRVRKNGRMFCAFYSNQEDGDIYINDWLHYEMSVIHKVIGTTKMEVHSKNGGEWYWLNNVPENVEIDKFYSESVDTYNKSSMECILDRLSKLEDKVL